MLRSLSSMFCQWTCFGLSVGGVVVDSASGVGGGCVAGGGVGVHAMRKNGMMRNRDFLNIE